MNLANRITMLRLAMMPFFMVFTIIDNFYTRLAALVIFITASITDLYDGAIARRTNTVTTLGIFLDPLVDKLMISAAFISFVQISELHIPAWMVVLIISREFLITGLRLVAAARGRILPATRAGKFKTSSQITAIITIMVILCVSALLTRYWAIEPAFLFERGKGMVRFAGWLLAFLPYWLMFITTVLTIMSGWGYLKRNIDLLRE